MNSRKMHLNFHGNWAGEHSGAWKVASDRQAEFRLDYYTALAQGAERGLFDGIFYAAGLALHEGPGRPTTPGLDPVVLAAALAARTRHIGLVVTMSTTFNDPYNVARTIASLDHVSGGRAAWNVVTTYDEMAALNFGMRQLPPKPERYARADEFVDVVVDLWKTWGTGSMVPDRDGARAEPSAIRPIDHRGRFFDVRGPLQLPPTRQGRPVLFQAGASEEGKTFAARIADGIFCVSLDLEGARRFYAEMKGRIADAGRDPKNVKILPGVYLYIGSTEAEAQRNLEENCTSDDALLQLAVRLSTDVANLSPDETVADEILDRALVLARSHGHSTAMVELFRKERLTVREFLRRQPLRGPHRVLVGTPEQVAQSLSDWFLGGAADGFNIGNLTLDGLNIFVDHVVPDLQARGLYRRAYDGKTLRANLMSD